MKALVVLFALVLISKGAIGQQSYFPILVFQWATARGCAAIPEWYNQEDIFDPPYVMGWLPGNREESAAYWCVSKNNSRKVRLIFEGESKCPKEIEWDSNRLLGLSVVNERLPLEWFTYWDDPKQRKGPTKVATRGPIVYAGDSGAGLYFYCYREKWLVRVVH